MKFITALAFVGVLVSSAFSHPATEENHRHHDERKELHETDRAISSIQRHEEERVREVDDHRDVHSREAETVKCEEVEENIHEFCSEHCAKHGNGSRHGQCVKGFCQCAREVVKTSRVSKREGRVTEMRCERVHESEEGKRGTHEVCTSHCRKLGREYKHGECVEGTCHCVRESVKTVNREVAEGVHSHPTVKCEHLIPLEGRPSSESHELCHAHCRSLGIEYIHGECMRSVCHCQRRQKSDQREHDSEEHPTVKCEHIHPLRGESGAENHEACHAHCRTVGARYVDGKCVEGVCKCRTGTIVKSVRAEEKYID